MAIEGIGPLKPIVTVTSAGGTESKQGAEGAAEAADTFGGAMKRAISEVNNLQSQADDMAVKLASGDGEDVHRAMIAMQKAKLALDLTITVRNKVVEAYQEVMRMQV